MKLENQVCSLELAKKLKELGVKQESLFSYHQRGDYFFGTEKVEALEPNIELTTECHNDFPYRTICSAFTVAELLELLPYKIDLPYDTDIYWGLDEVYYAQDKDVVVYGKYGFDVVPDALRVHIGNKEGVINSEADARAKMLIYLLENDLIK